MMPTHIETTNAANTGNIEISVPSGSEGDLLVAWVAVLGSVTPTPDESGWEQQESKNANSNLSQLTLYTRVRTASEPSTYGFTLAGVKISGILMDWSDAKVDVVTSTTNFAAAYTTTRAIAITPRSNDSYWLASFSSIDPQDDDNFTEPTGFSEVTNGETFTGNQGVSGDDIHIGVSYKAVDAGFTGSTNWTHDATTSDSKACVSLGLRSAHVNYINYEDKGALQANNIGGVSGLFNYKDKGALNAQISIGGVSTPIFTNHVTRLNNQ